MAVCLGILSVVIIIVTVVLLPPEVENKTAVDFTVKACPELNGEDIEDFVNTTASSLSLSPPLSLSSEQNAHTHAHSQIFSLSGKEVEPCMEALRGVGLWYKKTLPTKDEQDKFLKELSENYPEELSATVSIVADQITKMTTATRTLIWYTSILTIAPLFPVVIGTILLLVLLLCALCCFSVVKVCLLGASDSRTKIERDMREWHEQVDKGEIVREQDHDTLTREKMTLEERIEKFNKGLEDMKEKRKAIEEQIKDWNKEASDYSGGVVEQSGVLFDKLQKGKLALEKSVRKYNENIEDFD